MDQNVHFCVLRKKCQHCLYLKRCVVLPDRCLLRSSQVCFIQCHSIGPTHRYRLGSWDPVASLYQNVASIGDNRIFCFVFCLKHWIMHIVKGIVSDSYNTCLWHKSDDINQQRLFPKFLVYSIFSCSSSAWLCALALLYWLLC